VQVEWFAGVRDLRIELNRGCAFAEVDPANTPTLEAAIATTVSRWRSTSSSAAA